jgi:hypothetical protein
LIRCGEPSLLSPPLPFNEPTPIFSSAKLDGGLAQANHKRVNVRGMTIVRHQRSFQTRGQDAQRRNYASSGHGADGEDGEQKVSLVDQERHAFSIGMLRYPWRLEAASLHSSAALSHHAQDRLPLGELPPGKVVLVAQPHHDDHTTDYGLGGVIARFVESGYKAYYVRASNDEKDGANSYGRNDITNLKETKDAIKILGMEKSSA